eukprot:TRINITY_DN12118_c0_g1_i1.p1 TRINITY_DN12118_c0_g1~~TRINITY_DN12118_c0_g1_i1.p1  ORF type:complete len:456 (+),score=96.29 TRINITY_DN12118_c0_g1_i1:111-1478(+)
MQTTTKAFLVAVCSAARWASGAPPATEAEATGFRRDQWQSGLTDTDVKEVQHLLASPELRALGSWKANATALREMNGRLRANTFWGVEGFFQETVANELYEDFVSMAEESAFSLLTSETPPLTAGARKGLFAESEPVVDTCKRLEAIPFDYRHHDWTKDLTETEKTYKQVFKLRSAFMSPAWAKVVNILLKGTGFSVLSKDGAEVATRLNTGTVMFREFEPGDYSLLHTDNVIHGEKFRVLSINAWFSTPGWRKEYGGNFVWCGGDGNFQGAERLAPGFNEMALFLPLSPVEPEHGSRHAVEIVHDNHGRDYRRFSITIFMVLQGDAWRHWKARGGDPGVAAPPQDVGKVVAAPPQDVGKVVVGFENIGTVPLKLLWVRPQDGERQEAGVVPVNNNVKQSTFVGHVFEVANVNDLRSRSVVNIRGPGNMQCHAKADGEVVCEPAAEQPPTGKDEL